MDIKYIEFIPSTRTNTVGIKYIDPYTSLTRWKFVITNLKQLEVYDMMIYADIIFLIFIIKYRHFSTTIIINNVI